MSKPFIQTQLADLKQDIVGDIPLSLLEKWGNVEQSESNHDEILAPYTRHGIAISSDSSGLSKLSAQKSLLEVMQIVHKPKMIIFNHGKAIGGKAVGTWAADNTQMFYQENIDINEVVYAMARAQKQINEQAQIKVGISLHKGKFLEIGEGLFGLEADFVEETAEEHSAGGEILISGAVSQDLGTSFTHLLSDGPVKNTFRLDYSNLATNSFTDFGEKYPAPFDTAFYDLISKEISSEEELFVNNTYAKNKTVVLIKTHHPEQKYLLNNLTNWAIVKNIIYLLTKDSEVELVKSNGSLAIGVCKDEYIAIEYAKAVRNIMKGYGFDVTIGISSGEVYLFDLENGGKDIAGNPVNLASKLAEDKGKKGRIYLQGDLGIEGEKFQFEVSGVRVRGTSF